MCATCKNFKKVPIPGKDQERSFLNIMTEFVPDLFMLSGTMFHQYIIWSVYEGCRRLWDQPPRMPGPLIFEDQYNDM